MFHGRFSAESEAGFINSLVVYPTVRLQMHELFQQSAISRLAFRLADRTEQGGVERNEFFSLPLTLKCAFREVGDLTRDGVGRTVSAKRREVPSACPKFQ